MTNIPENAIIITKTAEAVNLRWVMRMKKMIIRENNNYMLKGKMIVDLHQIINKKQLLRIHAG